MRVEHDAEAYLTIHGTFLFLFLEFNFYMGPSSIKGFDIECILYIRGQSAIKFISLNLLILLYIYFF